VEVASDESVSEGIYHEWECEDNWEDIGFGRWCIGWEISSDASLSAVLVTRKNWKNVHGQDKVGNTYKGGC
jgi:hypothetical protein